MLEVDYYFKRCLVFHLRLKDFTWKHESLCSLHGIHARRVDWLPFLPLGKGTGVLRTDPLDLDAQRTLELEEFRSLLLHVEGRSHAVAAVAAGAADAVDEVLRHFGQIVIDDVRDVLHVNPPRSQVRRHQHAEPPLLKSRQCRGALRLRAVAMNHGRGESLAIQALGNSFGSAL